MRRCEIPGNYRVFEALTFGGLRNLCAPREKKNNTKAPKSVTYHHLSLFKVRTERNKNYGIKVECLEGDGYFLVQLENSKHGTGGV